MRLGIIIKRRSRADANLGGKPRLIQHIREATYTPNGGEHQRSVGAPAQAPAVRWCTCAGPTARLAPLAPAWAREQQARRARLDCGAASRRPPRKVPTRLVELAARRAARALPTPR